VGVKAVGDHAEAEIIPMPACGLMANAHNRATCSPLNLARLFRRAQWDARIDPVLSYRENEFLGYVGIHK